ncbi:hypothetical protein [Acidithiobacillus sp.]
MKNPTIIDEKNGTVFLGPGFVKCRHRSDGSERSFRSHIFTIENQFQHAVTRYTVACRDLSGNLMRYRVVFLYMRLDFFVRGSFPGRSREDGEYGDGDATRDVGVDLRGCAGRP